MELNWSTFFLELLNFLILLWILKRFFYKPVLQAITERRLAIEKTLADAKVEKVEAEALKSRYEGRLTDWEREKEAGREALRREIAEQRERLRVALEAELDQEREKARVLEERRQQDCLRKYEEICLAQGTRFVSHLLSRVATPELERRLCDLVMEDLEHLPAERVESVRISCAEYQGSARIVSAYPMDTQHRTALAEKLEALVGAPIPCEFVEDNSLLAGVRIVLGPWVFAANLRDELKGFTEFAHEPR